MTDDAELLRRYAEEQSEEAFAELVRRRIDFVYAAALRQTRGNSALAQDIAQTVFIDLARKATALSRHEAVLGWLHTSTRFAAGKAMRTESRRRTREWEVHVMNETLQESEAPADWARLSPVLDAVLGELKERERVAILVRFFERQPLAQVAAKLSLSETAARSCIDRALDKMRERLACRGIVSTTAALSFALTSQATVVAPLGVTAAVTETALAGAVASGGAVAAIFMALSKLQVGAVAALVIAITGGLVWRNPPGHRQPQQPPGSVALNDAKGSVTQSEAGTGRAEMPAVPSAARKPDYLPTVLHVPANRGRGTPMDAYETLQWAAANGEVRVLADSLVLTPRALRDAEELLAAAPEETRQKYPTPYLMAALLLSGSSSGYDPSQLQVQLLKEDDGAKPPDASDPNFPISITTYLGLPEETVTSTDYRTLYVKTRDGRGRESTQLGQVFEKTSDGWRWVMQPGLLKAIYKARIQKK